MAGEHRIPVSKEIYNLVKSYAIKHNMTISKITNIIYKHNVNVYNKQRIDEIIQKEKKVRLIK